jgi:hypothetical protein
MNKKRFFSAPNFCSRKSKSHDIVVISEKKQEHQGAAVGIRQRWNVYNSDIKLSSKDNQRLMVTHTHTERERIRFLAMSISSMGKDHSGDFLFPYQIQIKSSALWSLMARDSIRLRGII